MSVIPQKLNILETFVSEYHIDFYQREYKWKKPHVQSLLDDIFYRFELDYNPNKDASQENIDKYEWYYLSSCITNNYNGKIYIVDGQQRLTTLTLFLISLYHLAIYYKIENRKGLLETKIFGYGINGRTYWMGQNGRVEILRKLVEGKEINVDDSNISHVNIFINYKIINNYMTERLNTPHKYECFVLYFLTKILLIKIHIDQTKDVPMVFEVINDRGEKLKPYEVFKGEILGQLDKDEIETKYNSIWNQRIEPLESIHDEQPDNFFRYYFRSKYVDTANDYRDFDGEYHKTVFSKKWKEKIELKQSIPHIKNFVEKNLNYYAKLYYKLIDTNINNKSYGEYVFYNWMNEQDRQYLLILSSCSIDDPDENEKIITVAKLLDRHYVLLQLFGCYDSNSFTETILELNSKIRNQSLNKIEEIFYDQLLDDINNVKSTKCTQPFEYAFFKDSHNNTGIRFIRYFFARIENYISVSSTGHPLTKEIYHDIVRNTGSVNGHHIEHILAVNDENKTIFNNDEELFQRERNRLGALLLLKGKDNISSKNERYCNKLKTYIGCDLKWNKSLVKDFYHTNKDFSAFAKRENLSFQSCDKYDVFAVEERQKLLFELVKRIWG